jgi:hypothetical protein
MFKAEIKSISADPNQDNFIQKLSPVLHRCAALIVSQEEVS